MDKLIELHLHLDGSLRPETVWELAKEQNIKLPANTVDEVRDQMQVPEDCRTLEEYLTRFDLPLLVLQTREALERAAFELTEDLAKEGGYLCGDPVCAPAFDQGRHDPGTGG